VVSDRDTVGLKLLKVPHLKAISRSVDAWALIPKIGQQFHSSAVRLLLHQLDEFSGANRRHSRNSGSPPDEIGYFIPPQVVSLHQTAYDERDGWEATLTEHPRGYPRDADLAVIERNQHGPLRQARAVLEGCFDFLKA
jgi:hypothetical protein